MRGFIVLCLCAVSMAAPQGYTYNQGGSQGHQAGSAGFGGVAVGGSSSGSGFFQGGQAVQQGSFGGQQQVGFGGHQQVSFGGHQQVQQQASFGGHQQVQQQQQQQAIVSKRFFIHSAPEDNDEDYKEKLITVGVPKKNYNVVFIKSPSKSSKKTSIKISPAVNEEKTVIYVLSKKTDASDVQAEVIEQPSTTAKPEVFFIKYKTNEEAAHAQEQIQAQYDALGGSSQVTDEGVAPVTSVIGSLGGGSDAGAGAGAGGHIGGGSTGFGGAQVGAGNFGGVQSGGISGAGNFGGVQSGGISGASNSNAYLPPNFY